jgi:hypothetical protein
VKTRCQAFAFKFNLYRYSTDREELAGLRRDTRMAHLVGTCVGSARRGSDALSPASVSAAAWSLAIVSGERANSAEMEVLVGLYKLNEAVTHSLKVPGFQPLRLKCDFLVS